MEKIVEDFLQKTNVVAPDVAIKLGMQVFRVENPPDICRSNYPIVDRTLRLIIIVNEAQELLVGNLGRFHLKKAIDHSPTSRDEFMEFFLKSHGYFWSGTNASRTLAKLVTSRSFKFDHRDEIIAYNFRLSLSYKEYPFD